MKLLDLLEMLTNDAETLQETVQMNHFPDAALDLISTGTSSLLILVSVLDKDGVEDNR